MVDIWPATMPTIKPIVQILCEELPVKQGQHFGALLLRLRAEWLLGCRRLLGTFVKDSYDWPMLTLLERAS